MAKAGSDAPGDLKLQKILSFTNSQTKKKIDSRFNLDLVFFFEAEGSGEEAGVIGVSPHVRNASRLHNYIEILGLRDKEKEKVRSLFSLVVTWYLRPP